MNIKNEESGLSVVGAATESVAGVWVSDEKGDNVSLNIEPGKSPYLQISQQGDALPFAITHEGIQLSGKNDGSYRFIKWDDLFEMIQEYKEPSPS